MLTSWVVFEVWGIIAGLIVGVILLDFGEQGALVSNQHIIYALRPEARTRLNTIFMGGMFVGGEQVSLSVEPWSPSPWERMLALSWPRSVDRQHFLLHYCFEVIPCR